MNIDYTALYQSYFSILFYTNGPSKFGTTLMWTWATILGFRLSSSTLPNMLEEIKAQKTGALSLQSELQNVSCYNSLYRIYIKSQHTPVIIAGLCDVRKWKQDKIMSEVV